jgi:hypothetical protein
VQRECQRVVVTRATPRTHAGVGRAPIAAPRLVAAHDAASGKECAPAAKDLALGRPRRVSSGGDSLL